MFRVTLHIICASNVNECIVGYSNIMFHNFEESEQHRLKAKISTILELDVNCDEAESCFGYKSGIGPVRELDEKSNNPSCVHLLKDKNSSWPSKLLFPSDNDLSFPKLKNSEIGPSRWLSSRSKSSMLVRFHRGLGIEPERLQEANINRFEIGELKEATVGMKLALKLAATEIKLNHLSCRVVTLNSTP
ncbi:hypothetical protein H5410_000568 [Solanum commersonii]|uniref:Uncharacterized protein n=1 Tax=Solanum commersonii TaxID=4109 RepID=A0A9J6AXA6_SOLCO|nr:hypothetical protein H5410_000568 [Solanum commersonii]